MKTHNYSNTFLMISYGRQESESEMETLEQFSILANQIDHPGFNYVRYEYPDDFGFSTPVCIEKGLKTLFAAYPFPLEEALHPLEDLQNHFKTQSKYFGFEITLPEIALVKEGDKFLMKKDLDPALEIYLKMHELYPEGLMGFDRLGDVYRQKEDLQKSLKYYGGFLKFQPENPRIKSIIEEIMGEIKTP